MGLNKEDRILIKNLHQFKGYGSKRETDEGASNNRMEEIYFKYYYLNAIIFLKDLNKIAWLQQTIVDEAIKEWWRRLCTCVRVKGQQFEHLM